MRKADYAATLPSLEEQWSKAKSSEYLGMESSSVEAEIAILKLR